MRKTLDLIKWLSISVTVTSLVTVFWVWPAWNSGSQTWYWGNNSSSINPMYRNAYPPAGANSPFQFIGSFSASFMANEAALTMLSFGSDPWQYRIEWYETFMMMMMARDALDVGMGPVNFSLTIGRWMSMDSMRTYAPFFSATGSGGLGTKANPFVAMGTASMIPGVTGNLSFMPGDMLGAMVMISAPVPLTILLTNSASITSPFSDPGYPGAVGAPTLSQWGILALTILLASFSTFVIKRRIRIGRS